MITNLVKKCEHLGCLHSGTAHPSSPSPFLPDRPACTILTYQETALKIRSTLPLAASAFLLASCATRLPYPQGVDAAALLPAGAVAYARLDGVLLEEAARNLLSPGDLRSARTLLRKTDQVTLAVLSPGPSAAEESASALRQDSQVSLYGIAEGSYPAGAASFRLRLSPEWKREGRVLVNRGAGLRIAFAGRGLLAASNQDLDPLLARFAAPGPHPVPADLRALWETDGALWIVRPAALLAALGPEAPSLPARSVLLSLTAEADGYAGLWIFDFENERSARVFGPLCRLVHLAWIRTVYGADAQTANAELDRTVWSAAGGRISASGFSVRGPDLVRALSRLLQPKP